MAVYEHNMRLPDPPDRPLLRHPVSVFTQHPILNIAFLEILLEIPIRVVWLTDCSENMIDITCAPFPHRLHSVVVVVVVVISWFPPARRTVLNSVKKSRHCTRTSFFLSLLRFYSLFSWEWRRSVLQQVPIWSAVLRSWRAALRAVSSEAWTPTDCRTAEQQQQARVHSATPAGSSTPTERQNAPLALPLLHPPL